MPGYMEISAVKKELTSNLENVRVWSDVKIGVKTDVS